MVECSPSAYTTDTPLSRFKRIPSSCAAGYGRGAYRPPRSACSTGSHARSLGEYLCFRQARLTCHFESVTSNASPHPLDSLWTTVATTMFQRLKLLKDLLGLYLNRQQAKALLEQVQASNLSADDRDRVSQILRFMLRLPDESLPEPSAPASPLPARLTPPHHAKGQGQSAHASHRDQRDA